MKDKRFFSAIFAMAIFCLLNAAPMFGQCVIPITDSQPYFEDFEGDGFDCWTVEANGGQWAPMSGTESTVVCFSASNVNDEARLISPIFDMSGVAAATFSFSYAMMGLYESDELTVSYRSSETDTWHELGYFSFSDWENFYEEMYELPDLSSTYQISFLGRNLGGFYIFVDNIEIVSEQGCARPVGLQATDITAFSALLGWSVNGNEESWVLDYNGTNITVTEQPYLLDGLRPSTTYTFRVKANCGDGQESDWATPISFTTLCDVIVVTDNEPYFDDFEASEDFVCWQNEILAGSDGWVVDPGYVNPNNTAFFIWLGEAARLISAPLDLTAVTNPTLTFNRKQPQLSGAVDELSVYYRISEDEEWQFLGAYNEAASSWEPVSLSLPNPSATYQISFFAVSFNGYGIYVDDVYVGKGENVGVAETSVKASVMPNPTTGKVMVETNATDGEVVVFDMFGKQVASTSIREGRAEIDLTDCAKGVYVAHIASASSTTAIKLIKE